MGNVICDQLQLFFRSILLGGVLGLVYDLTAALRALGGRIWGGVLDTLYVLTSAATLFFFVMSGDGELRLFILLGTLGGGVLHFCLLSQPLRPLWSFWLGVFLVPFHILDVILKKCEQICKKLFSFSKKQVTIIGTKWQRYRPAAKTEGDKHMAKTQKKRPSSKLTALILVVLLFGVAVQLRHMVGQLSSARAEEAVYTARLADLQETNARLEADIANSGDQELIEEIAREDLGMAEQNEKIFRFGN